MTRALPILALVLTQGCHTLTEPGPLYPGYFLSAVDGDLLPVPYAEDGTVLVAGFLGFGEDNRPRTPGPTNGTVSYSLIVRQPGQPEQHSTIELDYSIDNSVLRINLCPPLALCIMSTELVGPITGPTAELVLTHYLGGNPGSVYRFFPALPD